MSFGVMYVNITRDPQCTAEEWGRLTQLMKAGYEVARRTFRSEDGESAALIVKEGFISAQVFGDQDVPRSVDCEWFEAAYIDRLKHHGIIHVTIRCGFTPIRREVESNELRNADTARYQ